MSLVDTSNDVHFLRQYLTRHSCNHDDADKLPIDPRVTVVSYFFRPDDQTAEHFPYLTQALMHTWACCGKLKTLVVTNGVFHMLEKFAHEHPNVSVQVEPQLIPGCVDSMSIDCNSKLHQRFDSEYALIVQDDGFPIRRGLDTFIGKYDYIGAPWRRPNILGLAAGYLHRKWPANGGFSLRSKKFCTLVSQYWNHHYAALPFDRAKHQDDIFCTTTLPAEHPTFSRQVRWANSMVAARFSYDASVPSNINRHPFGFHGAKAFVELYRAGLFATI